MLVVSKEVGLPMHTLRAWERRYGFPTPERRPGSNRRLYASADIERLIAIKRVLEAGYRIGDVVDKPLADLEALAQTALAKRAKKPAEQRAKKPAEQRVEPARPPSAIDLQRVLQMLARDETERVEEELRRFRIALDPKSFVTELAQPLAVAVGEAWARGEISVRHEHFATECLLTSLRAILSEFHHLGGRPVVLLTTLSGELHGLPLLFIAVYLAVSGATPRLLGTSTPTEVIVDAARVFGVDVVGLSVSASSDVDETKLAIRELERKLSPGVALWIGGGGAGLLGVGRRARVVQSWAALDEALDMLRA